LGDDAYYFQRASEWTGLASPGSSQDQDADMAVQRNNEMFGYLQDLTEQTSRLRRLVCWLFQWQARARQPRSIARLHV